MYNQIHHIYIYIHVCWCILWCGHTPTSRWSLGTCPGAGLESLTRGARTAPWSRTSAVPWRRDSIGDGKKKDVVLEQVFSNYVAICYECNYNYVASITMCLFGFFTCIPIFCRVHSLTSQSSGVNHHVIPLYSMNSHDAFQEFPSIFHEYLITTLW